ncbi:hypothetical protein SAMN05421890_4891 [Ensifer adhaerens]|nr:hypothetical protein SAMN05421890_4891 [Ensifer adhaerens]
MSNSLSAARANRRIIINDASCLIDLHKVDLVVPMLGLPFDFHVALPVKGNELLSISISTSEWEDYEQRGMQAIDLTPAQVARAMDFRELHPALSPEDCFSLVLAQDCTDGLLLTGDAALRNIAEASYGLEAHGVLWVADRAAEAGLVGAEAICACLSAWRDDPSVRLPHHLLEARLAQFQSNIETVT